MPKKTNPVRAFFSSVKLTIVLMILIALLAVGGTFLPQQQEAGDFLHRLPPAAAEWLLRLQLLDIYHSTVFYLLMSLLSLNLIVCSLNRFPSAWKKIRAPGFPVPEGLFPSAGVEQTFNVKEGKDTVVSRLESLARKRWGSVDRQETERGVFLFAQKGRFAHLGVYVVHMSILIIILGAVVGSLFGFEAYVTIDEGQAVQEVELKGGRGIRQLDFAVRCDKFTLEFYENGAPKTYRSDLSFLKDGKVIRQGALLVNHPLSFETIRFYQSSYGMSEDNKAHLSFSRNGVRQQPELVLTEGDVFELPGSQAKGTVLRVEENIMEMGPAVKLLISSPRGDVQFWVFRHIEEIKQMNPGLLNEMPLFNPALFKPYEFSLARVEQKYSTGLQIVRDPGVPLVAGGGILLIAGLMMTFWMSHRRFWIWIFSDRGGTSIHITGKSNRNPVAFEKEIRNLHAAVNKAMTI